MLLLSELKMDGSMREKNRTKYEYRKWLDINSIQFNSIQFNSNRKPGRQPINAAVRMYCCILFYCILYCFVLYCTHPHGRIEFNAHIPHDAHNSPPAPIPKGEYLKIPRPQYL